MVQQKKETRRVSAVSATNTHHVGAVICLSAVFTAARICQFAIDRDTPETATAKKATIIETTGIHVFVWFASILGCILLVRQIKQFAVPIPFQEAIESLHKAVLTVGIGLGDVLHVGADEDQATGAALAFAGGDTGTVTFEWKLPWAKNLSKECKIVEINVRQFSDIIPDWEKEKDSKNLETIGKHLKEIQNEIIKITRYSDTRVKRQLTGARSEIEDVD